jgi:hypothetical protein
VPVEGLVQDHIGNLAQVGGQEHAAQDDDQHHDPDRPQHPQKPATGVGL